MMWRQRQECDRQREETSKARRILGKTRDRDKIANTIKYLNFVC
jgi:hypothetical protein